MTINLSENARTVLERRYIRRDGKGKPIETIEELFRRVSHNVSLPDIEYGTQKQTEQIFYEMLTNLEFLPNSPTFTGAGTPLGQLAACFVLPIEDDLAKTDDSILGTLKVAALIQQSGGGNGFSFSGLRSRGTTVSKSNGKSTGPIGFMKMYDVAFDQISQGGIRRGANMAVMRVDHPNIRDFIRCKSIEGEISNFNISVAITDIFMEAVINDTIYDLVDPHTKEITETPKAKEIFNLLIDHSFKNGEPGVLFIDEANRHNPVPHLYKLEATNPCAEQWLGPYENCCLGSINLYKHLNGDKIDWEKLKKTIYTATHFLDNVVTENKYIPSFPKIEEAALNSRRIGLGFMGLGDVFYVLGIRYGSKEAQELASQITEFMRFHCMKKSIELAKQRGSFLKIEGSIYDKNNFTWEIPKSLINHVTDFGRESLNWNKIVTDIKHYGIRNAAQTTIAPTGTLATVSGLEGYGCEPVFALAYLRNVYQAAGDLEKLTLTYISPLFKQELEKLELTNQEEIIKEIVRTGTCQHIKELLKEIRNTFVVSSDITPEEHIKMQAAIQVFIDNSISKTCNFPETATKENIREAYLLGWQLKCKGLTVYVTGSRKEVVLEVEKEVQIEYNDAPKRPQTLPCNIHEFYIHGKRWYTVVGLFDNKPYEVFAFQYDQDLPDLPETAQVTKNGKKQYTLHNGNVLLENISSLIEDGGLYKYSEEQTLARLVSLSLRHGIKPDFIFDQISKSAGTLGSFSRALVKVLNLYVENNDKCPECGGELIASEGCWSCSSCHFSKC